MNLQEWIIVVGVVIILGILVDGLRRVRQAKQDSLKMSRDLGGQMENTPLDDDYNPELPGGGARVIATGDDSGSEDTSGFASISAKDTFDPLAESSEPSLGLDLSDTDDAKTEIKKERTPAKTKKTAKASSAKAKVVVNEPLDHEVIVINVDARPGQVFTGEAIKGLLEACGMKHGEMSIFHRHEEDDLLSPVQFSVANAVEPGYFEPESLNEIQTPGVSFFMSIPGPKDYLKAFEFMHETAKCFAENLHGELKDENRSVLTSQTIEHCKQRIREFERKQLCKARP